MGTSSTRVKDAQGTEGTLNADLAPEQETAVIVLEAGRRVVVPRSRLTRQSEGSYRFEGLFENLETDQRAAGEASVVEEKVLPLVEEEVRVRKEKRETGRVHIRKRVEERTQVIDEPLEREDVDVERVPVDAVIDEPAQVRQDGETTIIPIMEERLVVVKELVLKEELHVTRRRTTHRDPQKVTLRRETAEVERSAPPPSDAPPPHDESASPQK